MQRNDMSLLALGQGSTSQLQVGHDLVGQVPSEAPRRMTRCHESK